MTEATRAAAVVEETAPVARRIVTLTSGVILLLIGLLTLGWALLVEPEARVPVGEGWIDGHFYHQSSDDRATTVLGVAALFGVGAFALTLAASQFRMAFARQRLSARWLIGVPGAVAIASCVLAVALPREYCDPNGCREAPIEMH